MRGLPAAVNVSRSRGLSSPKASRLAGFSSMTRVRSSVARLLVTPDTSLASADTCTGFSIFQPAPSFFSVVTSPLEAVSVNACDLVGLERGEDLLALRLIAGGLALHLDEPDVGAERRGQRQQDERRTSALHPRLRLQVQTPSAATISGRPSTDR